MFAETLNSPSIEMFAPLAMVRVQYAVGLTYEPLMPAVFLYTVAASSNGTNSTIPLGIL